LRRLEFDVKTSGKKLSVTAPDHRLDIGEGVIGQADLMEEIARVYGYERIPATRMRDELPPQRGDRNLDIEENIRDVLARLGLQEIMTYRLTRPEEEARRLPKGTPPHDAPYVRLANPISQDRTVLRKSLLASVLEVMERNAKRDRDVRLYGKVVDDRSPKPTAGGGGVSVTAPNGKTYTFPNQAQADVFKKRAGIK